MKDSNTKKYRDLVKKARPVALSMMQGPEKLTGREIMDRLEEIGLPRVSQKTLTRWRTEENLQINTVRDIALDLRRSHPEWSSNELVQALGERVLKVPCLTTIRSWCRKDGVPFRPSGKIRKAVEAKLKKPRKVTPWNMLEKLGSVEALSLRYDEAFQVLENAEIHHQVQTAAIMAHFYGDTFSNAYNNTPLKGEEPDEIQWREAA